MGWKTLDDMDLAGKVVLTRVDINVPVEDGEVTDTTRIDRIVPTVSDILASGGKPVLLAHFGRPKGQPNPEMSLHIVRPALENALGVPVRFAEDCIGAAAKTAVAALQDGPFTVGFAAETDDLENYARGKLAAKNLNMIAANTVAGVDSAFNADDNALQVFWPGGEVGIARNHKSKVARELIELIARKFKE